MFQGQAEKPCVRQEGHDNPDPHDSRGEQLLVFYGWLFSVTDDGAVHRICLFRPGVFTTVVYHSRVARRRAGGSFEGDFTYNSPVPR